MINVNDIKVGDTFEEVIVDNLTRTQIVQYAGFLEIIILFIPMKFLLRKLQAIHLFLPMAC